MSRMRLVRFWMPLGITVTGLGAMLAGLFGGNDNWAEGGALLASAGLSVWLLNALYRVGVSGDKDRDEEDEARAYFDAHGRWPDEDAGEGPQPRARGEDPHRRPPSGADRHRRRRPPPPRR